MRQIWMKASAGNDMNVNSPQYSPTGDYKQEERYCYDILYLFHKTFFNRLKYNNI